MQTAVLLIAAAMALSVLYLAVQLAAGAFLKFRGSRVVTCPQNQQPAGVEVDATHAALTALREGPELRLKACSRWPERRDCGQNCLQQIESAPEGCLVRTILTKWYEAKSCAFCGKPLGKIRWTGRKPALMSPNRKTVEWSEVRAETVPLVITTHQPACWNCHIVNRFMGQHPELIVDRCRTAGG